MTGLGHYRDPTTGAWTPVEATDPTKVAKIGDKMTGNLEVESQYPALIVDTNDAADGYGSLHFASSGVNRWVIRSEGAVAGDPVTGSDGQNFNLISRDNAGAFRAYVLRANRNTGLMTVAGDPTTGLGIATKQYVDNLFNVTAVESTAINWDTLETPGIYKKLMHGTSNPNGPGTVIYYYVNVYYYGAGSITQWAIPYSASDTNGPAYRSRYNGVWTAWSTVATQGWVTAEMAGDYLPLTGGTLTGDLRVNGGRVFFDTPAGAYAGPQWVTAGVVRWWLYKVNSAESGSNAGSDLYLSRYSDAGASLGVALTISRATGDVDITSTPAVALSATGLWVPYVGSFTVVKNGSIVSLEGFLRYTGSAFTIAAGAQYTLATIPSGYRPSGTPNFPAMFSLTASNGGLTATRGQVDSAGVLSFYVPTSQAGSMPQNGGWLILNATWEKA